MSSLEAYSSLRDAGEEVRRELARTPPEGRADAVAWTQEIVRLRPDISVEAVLVVLADAPWMIGMHISQVDPPGNHLLQILTAVFPTVVLREQDIAQMCRLLGMSRMEICARIRGGPTRPEDLVGR